MKRIITAVAIAAALTLTMAPAAEATPRYGRDYTSGNGWIVWVRGDAALNHIRCTWYAGNKSWHVNWLLQAYQYGWAMSDAGKWGDHRPEQLNCTHHRV